VNASRSTLLDATPYAGYLYSYPHKTAYRPLTPTVPLAPLWAGERREALFLYLHVPFCEMRCGFCNLFTSANPKEDMVASYVRVIESQARAARRALDEGGAHSFARLAVGGGTPTILDEAALERLFKLAEETMGADAALLPTSIETSPETATVEKLRLLVQRGVDRVSIGVQSFLAAETQAVNRPQDPTRVHAALEAIREAGAPTLNVDLIYGLPGQTVASWLHTLDEALRHKPEELYLYPLYVRPLTTLGRGGRGWDDLRLALYRIGREHLLAAGYEQISMRMFRAGHAPAADGPVYCCQQDGMLGLGCGARSYTEGLHYATEYAVDARGVKEILKKYLERDEASFDVADWGFALDDEDRRRRHVALSLLSNEGLTRGRYTARFGSDVVADLPELDEIVQRGYGAWTGDVLRLNDRGIERSDAIGPWLQSARVRALMEAWEER
jgi:oxygen-independent coproporphyrinogen III oxidase